MGLYICSRFLFEKRKSVSDLLIQELNGDSVPQAGAQHNGVLRIISAQVKAAMDGAEKKMGRRWVYRIFV